MRGKEPEQERFGTGTGNIQGKVFSTHIRNAIALAEAPTQGQDIFHYAPKSAGAEDYEGVCIELLTEIK